MRGKRLLYERRGRMLGLADAQTDRRPLRRRRHALVKQTQFFERIGLKLGETRVHERRGNGLAPPFYGAPSWSEARQETEIFNRQDNRLSSRRPARRYQQENLVFDQNRPA